MSLRLGVLFAQVFFHMMGIFGFSFVFINYLINIQGNSMGPTLGIAISVAVVTMTAAHIVDHKLEMSPRASPHQWEHFVASVLWALGAGLQCHFDRTTPLLNTAFAKSLEFVGLCMSFALNKDMRRKAISNSNHRSVLKTTGGTLKVLLCCIAFSLSLISIPIFDSSVRGNLRGLPFMTKDILGSLHWPWIDSLRGFDLSHTEKDIKAGHVAEISASHFHFLCGVCRHASSSLRLRVVWNYEDENGRWPWGRR